MDDAHDVVLTVRGERVGLGPIRRDLLPIYQRWMNDLRVTRTLSGNGLPMTREAEAAWLDQALTGPDATFTIYELESLRPIGNCGLHGINLHDGTAEFGIVIGEPDLWDKGYGSEATRLVLGYGFDVLGLYNIMLEVYANNPRAIRVYERAGFRLVGTRRGAKKRGRERVDVILMDAIADDVPASDLHAIMHPDHPAAG